MTPRKRKWLVTGVATLLFVLGVLLLTACGGGDDGDGGDEPEAQTIQFQEPTDPGPSPFTEPADVEGEEEVDVQRGGNAGEEGEQPFGGSGSNRVCDRDKLIRFLEDNPAKLREWARVLGISPTKRAVRRYIAKLHPVTLTKDTAVTNHRFVNGRAEPFQAILQAGTAVLVDKYGVPVVRCFCGNPLRPAVPTPTAKCTGCPPNYRPPQQCRFGRRSNYDETYYRRDYYSNGDYDETFIRRHRSSPFRDCYEAYPDPPRVRIVRVFRAPPPEPEPEPQAPPEQPAQPEPEPEPGGLNCEAPRSQLEFEQCREREHPTQPEPEPEPQPEPEDCAGPPPAHPGEDYLERCSPNG